MLGGYRGLIEAGWATGIHDCRELGFAHPWVVANRAAKAVVGCWSREETRWVHAELKLGADPERLQGLYPPGYRA
jgi:hypothetical protein